MTRVLCILFCLFCATANAAFTNLSVQRLGAGTLNALPTSLTDWAQRVVNNGGAEPSQATINAMEAFRAGVIADGISNKMIWVDVFVPGNLIAATTPIFKGQGYDPAVNHGFVLSDLTVDGLKGDGSTKYLDTGVKANSGGAFNAVNGNVGLSVIVSELGGNNSSVLVGHNTSTTSLIWLFASGSVNSVIGNTAFFTRTTGLNDTTYTNDFGRCGFVSGNSVSNATSIYVQSPLVSQRTLATNSVVSNPTASATDTIFAFAEAAGTSPDLYSGSRMSVVAIHDGLTASEAALFAARLFTLRTALGGGTGDEVTDWAAIVVRYGGAAPSEATKTVLRTAYTSLNTSGVLTQSVSLNFLVPDSLVAASIPVVWKAGYEMWTNNLFGTTNLSVNGLSNSTTNKYLKTGIVASTVAANTGFNINSAGVHLMIATNVGGASYCNFGSWDGAGSQQWSVVTDAGTTTYYCWGYGTTADNAGFSAPSPTATWRGFLSGNRIANTNVAIYRASTANSFAVGSAGTGAARSAIAVPTIEAYAFALNNNGAVNPSPNTLSFIGVTSGLTSAQSSNLYYIVSTARTALGGGSP